MAATSLRTEPTPLPTPPAEETAPPRDPFRALQRAVEDHDAALSAAALWGDPELPEGTDASEEEEQEAPVERLGPCDVRLSDGRIATLRKTRGLHDLRMGRFLTRIGYTVQSLGADVFGEVKALLCLEGVRNAGEPPEKMRPHKTPTSEKELEYAMHQFTTVDLMTLAIKYAEVNLGLTLTPPGMNDAADADLPS